MTPLCSILIPTRERYDGLYETMLSVIESSNPKANIEFVLRVDNDDPFSYEKLSERPDIQSCKILLGPQLNGWYSNHTFYNECANAATGDWVWIMNDDALVLGKGWDEQLSKLPKEGVFVQPEFYGLNDSKYVHCADIGFPIVPRDSWKKLGKPELEHPIDSFLYKLLVVQNGWKVEYLKGITVQHNRKEPQQNV